MKFFQWFWILPSLFILSLCFSYQALAKTRVVVRIPAHAIQINLMEEMGFIRDHQRDGVFVYGYLEQDKVPMLSGLLRHEIEVLELDLPAPRIKFEGFHDYVALTEELKTLQKNYPDLVRLQSAGKSVRGRELWYLVLSDNPTDFSEPEPRLLYLANMHGDEVVGRELMIYLSRLLLSEYGKDENTTQLLNNAQIVIMPSMNPDGFEAGTRWNANSEDLNRNFPDEISDPNNSPQNREPETQHIMALNEKFHFNVGINWHGGELCMNIPWDIRPNNNPATKFGDDPFIFQLSRNYADLNTPMYQNHYSNFDHGVTYGYEWYPIYGGIQDYFNTYGRSIMATGEISKSKLPSASSLNGFWNDNRKAMIQFLIESLEGLHIHVTDPSGKGLSSVTLTTGTMPKRKVSYPGPYINKPALSGFHEVLVEAPGYEPLKLTLESTPFDGSFTTVFLTPRK